MKGLKIKKVCGYWTLARNGLVLASSEKLSEVISIGETSGVFEVEEIKLRTVEETRAQNHYLAVVNQEPMIRGY